MNKNTKLFIFGLILGVIVYFLFDLNAFGASSADLRQPLENFYDVYGYYVNLFTAFIIISNLGIFIYHFSQLAMHSSNPQARSKAINDLVICGVCLALISGGATIVYILFFLAN